MSEKLSHRERKDWEGEKARVQYALLEGETVFIGI